MQFSNKLYFFKKRNTINYVIVILLYEKWYMHYRYFCLFSFSISDKNVHEITSIWAGRDILRLIWNWDWADWDVKNMLVLFSLRLACLLQCTATTCSAISRQKGLQPTTTARNSNFRNGKVERHYQKLLLYIPNNNFH